MKRWLPTCENVILSAFLSALLGCGSREGDPAVTGVIPPAGGPDKTIHDVAAPGSPDKAANLQAVRVSGAVVVAIDDFDETQDGKSKGTVYVQDLASRDEAGKPIPYAGISLFAPSYVPGNLKVGIGDALDLQGTFQANQQVGSGCPTTSCAIFPPGALLEQIAQPLASFRFEVTPPEPFEIPIEDLHTYETGRKWIGMLVKVKNVTVYKDVARSSTSARLNVPLLPADAAPPGAATGCTLPFPKPPELVNELADVPALNIPKNTVIKSITGVVSYFCTIHIAPRSLADVEL